MKKRVLTVFLSLLACLCCCFSGFGSVKVFALTTTYPQYNLNLDQGVHSDTINKRYALGDDNIFYCDISSAVTVSDGLVIRLFDDQSDTDTMLNFPIMPDVYDYYIYTSYAQHNSASDGGTFQPTGIVMSNGTGSNEYPSRLSDIQVYRTYYASNNSNYNLNKMNFVAKLNLAEYSSINYISAIKFTGPSGTLKSRQFFEFSVFLVPKGEAEAAAAIVAAIEEQTGSLGGKLDSIDQSIEDQYQMEDEEDFGFSDIQQQYEEKMGVLTFGTETTIQMLELFSPSNAGEAYIRVPGWSMDVQGETYQIWDEYVFYFDSIEENFPFLVTTMRTFTVAMFYVAIVGYITKVYERNFLAK